MRQVTSGAGLDEAAMARALAQLAALVKARGLNSSATRAEIARAALSRRGHFSVEELATDLRARGAKDAHTATVYRVLPLLVDAGLLQLTLVSGKSARYERAFEREHHDHLVCTGCGKIVEFEAEAVEALQREIAARFGFLLTDHVHELRGVCADCRPGARRRRAR
ncbi:MAG: transcriptional repressor [Polyangiaceae bacterium]|nr:transcriptional repressor [Polyangiaceae bacterium]